MGFAAFLVAGLGLVILLVALALEAGAVVFFCTGLAVAAFFGAILSGSCCKFDGG
jgi:hypothetical protein